MFCWLTRGPYLLKLIHPWLSGRPRRQAATFFEVTELTIVANSGPCKNNQNHTTHIRISLQGMQVVWIREGTDLMDHQTLLQAHTNVLGFRMKPYEFHSGQMPVRRLKDEHYRRENGKMLCGLLILIRCRMYRDAKWNVMSQLLFRLIYWKKTGYVQVRASV